MSRAGRAAFGEITRRYLAEGFFRGAVLRVERQGALLHEEAWGNAIQTEEERLPVTASTLFDIASLSKLFTTTAVLRLVTLGALRLDGKAADLLGTDLDARLRIALTGVDVTALLAHSSGIRAWYPLYAAPAASRPGNLFPILADVLAGEPRQAGIVYSDLNFMILGAIVERVSGGALPQAIRNLVLEPLRLGRSSFAHPLGPAAATESGNQIEKRMVAALGLSFDGWRGESRPIVGEVNDGNTFYFFQGAAGHAGIFSDARDLCRLAGLYLDGGRIDEASFLDPLLVEEAMQDHGGGRGLGFQLGELYPEGACGHTGFTGTYLMVSRGTGLAVAILTNRLHVPEPRDLTPYRRELATAALSTFG